MKMLWILGFLLGYGQLQFFNGFSKNKKELNYYFPTNDLVTAPEIMFFWVARMIISGYEYENKPPFKMSISQE